MKRRWRRTHGRSALVLALCALPMGCQTFRPADVSVGPELEAAELGDMAGVSRFGDLWISGQPSRTDLDIARRRGIRTVLDLQASQEGTAFLEADTCDEFGLSYLRVAINPDSLEEEQLDRALALLARSEAGPTLLHCESGSRAAMLFAVYRVVVHGVDLEEALDEAFRAGMKPGSLEALVREQSDRILSRQMAHAERAQVAYEPVGI